MSQRKSTRRARPVSVSWRDYADQQMKNPAFRAEYEALEPEFALTGS